MSLECGWYRIFDESQEDYLYPPQAFEIVEEYPKPPIVEPSPYDDSHDDDGYEIQM